MNISEIKQLQAEGWVDFAGQIIEIKETKQRTKSNLSKSPGQVYNVTKLKIKDMTDTIGAWAYTQTQPFVIRQLVTGRGMLKIHQTGARYLDYATLQTDGMGQAAPPQPPQAPQQAVQGTKAPQNGKDTSIERQAAGRSACLAWDKASPEEIMKLAIAMQYFHETGKNYYEIPQPDESITEPQTSPEDDIPF